MKKRCDWCGEDPTYQAYHDNVWGRPVYDSRELFAKLCLDGQQAGLSWITILKKQASYYEAYDQFDPNIIIHYDDNKRQNLLSNPGIIRNKLKVESIIKNAKGYLAIESEGQSFSEFIWSFVDGKPVKNRFTSMSEIPVNTEISDAMSKALKAYGFSFVGSTICYAFMQACGLVNDHITSCHCFDEVDQL
jgi:DNA-3-methyladenine glycosylase I